MQLEFDISSDSGLEIIVNGESQYCYADKLCMNIEYSETVTLQIKQLTHKRKWYLFVLYFIEGIFTALVCAYSGYSFYEYLHPYLYQCCCTIAPCDHCKISISSLLSKVTDDNVCTEGFINVCGEHVLDMYSSSIINEYTFNSVFIKTIFSILSVPIVLFGVLSLIVFNSQSISVGGLVFVAIITISILLVCAIKIQIERKK